MQAFLQVSADLALAAAAATDKNRAAGKQLGALAGVPVAFKDNLHLVGTRTTCASKMLENYESVFTATCVSRMLDAGATPMGKTNMDEFAFGSSTESSYFHPTANPWDVTRVPGGSSGGSAACVAAGEVPLSLGSDTGGSIRQPASFCGVVGFKPSYGVVSRYGVVAFGSSLDQVGPFGHSVEDVALAMNALVGAGVDSLDSTNQAYPVDFMRSLHNPIEGKRIGIVRSMLDMDGVSCEVRTAMQQAMDAFERVGAVLVDVDLPHIDAAIAAYYVIAPCEAFSNLARFDGVRYGFTKPGCSSLAEQTSQSRAVGFGQEARRRQLLGAYLLSSEAYNKYYYPAQQVRTLITQDYTQAFTSCDALLLPTSPTTAFSFGQMEDPTQMYASDLFTISNNIVGNAGISVPMGLGEQTGLPVSVQLQGPAFADQQLLQIACALEQEVKVPLRVAPAFAGRGGELA